MTFIDHDQREIFKEGIFSLSDRLDATENHLLLAILLIQSRGIDPCMQAITLILQMVLLDQFFDMRQHQHAAYGYFSQLRDDQTFTCAGRQHDHRRVASLSEVIEGAINCFLLVCPECIHRGGQAI